MGDTTYDVYPEIKFTSSIYIWNYETIYFKIQAKLYFAIKYGRLMRYRHYYSEQEKMEGKKWVIGPNSFKLQM